MSSINFSPSIARVTFFSKQWYFIGYFKWLEKNPIKAWDMSMNEILIASSVNQRLKGEELKILNYLLGSFGSRKEFFVLQEKLSSELHLHRPQVTRAIRKLEEEGFIERTRSRHYILKNPKGPTQLKIG
jgi:DNA-binding MarR family transcriptional regulator